MRNIGYKIVEKNDYSKVATLDNSKVEIPMFWIKSDADNFAVSLSKKRGTQYVAYEVSVPVLRY
jgi:hypothetical protein